MTAKPPTPNPNPGSKPPAPTAEERNKPWLAADWKAGLRDASLNDPAFYMVLRGTMPLDESLARLCLLMKSDLDEFRADALERMRIGTWAPFIAPADGLIDSDPLDLPITAEWLRESGMLVGESMIRGLHELQVRNGAVCLALSGYWLGMPHITTRRQLVTLYELLSGKPWGEKT